MVNTKGHNASEVCMEQKILLMKYSIAIHVYGTKYDNIIMMSLAHARMEICLAIKHYYVWCTTSTLQFW